MAKTDLFKAIEGKQNKLDKLQDSLIEFCDKLLNASNITDKNKLKKIAQLRAFIDIHFKDLNA